MARPWPSDRIVASYGSAVAERGRRGVVWLGSGRSPPGAPLGVEAPLGVKAPLGVEAPLGVKAPLGAPAT